MKYILYVVIVWGFVNLVIAIIHTLKISKSSAEKIKSSTGKANDSLNSLKERIKNMKPISRFITKGLILIFFTALFIIVMAIITSPIVLPIFLRLQYGLIPGLISLVVFSALLMLWKIIIIKKKTNDDRYLELAVINETLNFMLFFFLAIIIIDPFDFSLNGLILYFYNMDFTYKIETIVFIPIIFISFVTLNLYFLIKKLQYSIKPNIDKYKKVDMKSYFLVAVLSSFIGLFFLNNLDKSFMSEREIEVYKGAINIFSILMSSILIPLLLNKLNIKRDYNYDMNNKDVKIKDNMISNNKDDQK